MEHGEDGTADVHEEQAAESGGEVHEEGEEPHGESAEAVSSEEELFGLDIESPLAVTGAAIATAGLALLVLFVPASWPLALAILLCLAFAALDVREALHQQDEGRASIAAIARILLVIHLTVALLSAGTLSRGRRAVYA